MVPPGQPFDITITGSTIAMAGELDLHSAPAVVAAAEAADVGTIDLSEVSFIDSSGVRALLTIEQRAAAAGRRLALVNPSERVTAVLSMLGLLERFEIATAGDG